MRNIRLTEEFYNWHNPNAFAITIVLNRSQVSSGAGKAILRQFAADLDEARLGGRYYSKPNEERLHATLSPEKFDTGHPHYHGIVKIPDADIEKYGLDGIQDYYEGVLRKRVPNASIRISPISDPTGWIDYCSKEHDLIHGDPDKIIWTRFFPSHLYK